MAKYIDVESLVVAYSGHTPDDEFSKGVDFVLDLLDSKPPADVKPVVRGRWVDDGCITRCKYCGEEKEFPHWRFCPNCGSENNGTNR